ncbi:hypothetical protein OsI_01729 [Oryza sativa Indica Group]|uniref:PGG domain-containing protein n=1 Tax=Oryza sativa subsp. indica TaxID=39946 RepID=A2WPF5_ORYSI|nr:hypothetical protein OsI_01729 [Oryza sativa Indica Group]
MSGELRDAILNMQDKDGNTAIHLAVQLGDMDLASCLMMNHKNQRRMIYRLLLVYCDAPSGNLSGVTTFLSRTSPAENEAEESKKIIESTQILGIGSVLVAAVAFAGPITMPGGYRADDHHHGGALTLAGEGKSVTKMWTIAGELVIGALKNLWSYVLIFALPLILKN